MYVQSTSESVSSSPLPPPLVPSYHPHHHVAPSSSENSFSNSDNPFANHDMNSAVPTSLYHHLGNGGSAHPSTIAHTINHSGAINHRPHMGAVAMNLNTPPIPLPPPQRVSMNPHQHNNTTLPSHHLQTRSLSELPDLYSLAPVNDHSTPRQGGGTPYTDYSEDNAIVGGVVGGGVAGGGAMNNRKHRGHSATVSLPTFGPIAEMAIHPSHYPYYETLSCSNDHSSGSGSDDAFHHSSGQQTFLPKTYTVPLRLLPSNEPITPSMSAAHATSSVGRLSPYHRHTDDFNTPTQNSTARASLVSMSSGMTTNHTYPTSTQATLAAHVNNGNGVGIVGGVVAGNVGVLCASCGRLNCECVTAATSVMPMFGGQHTPSHSQSAVQRPHKPLREVDTSFIHQQFLDIAEQAAANPQGTGDGVFGMFTISEMRDLYAAEDEDFHFDPAFGPRDDANAVENLAAPPSLHPSVASEPTQSHLAPTDPQNHHKLFLGNNSLHSLPGNFLIPRMSGVDQQTHHRMLSGQSSMGYTLGSEFVRETRWDIVYLTSSPLVFGNGRSSALDQLNIKEERTEFFETLQQAEKELSVIHMTATTGNMVRAVTGGCRCIHYSGHGFPDYLAFEDEKNIGDTHLVHVDLIRTVCTDEDQRIEFVFASACHSENVGNAFIQAGIPHVVAVEASFEVTDEAATVFTRHFYDSLLNGFTIARSFHTARNAVSVMSSLARRDSDKFLLLPEHGDHNVRLFQDLKKGKFRDLTPPIPPNNLPPPIPTFIGRAVDMRNIIHQIMDNGVRLLVLTGEPGIGKSATAQMVAKYFSDRHIFKGVFLVDIHKLTSTCQTLGHMLRHCFSECDDPQFHGLETDIEMYAKMRSVGKMLVVFDGLDKFSEDEDPMFKNKHVIQSFLQNIFDRSSVETKIVVTSNTNQHAFADLTGCLSRYYTLQKLKPKDSAILFSRLCNQFRHTDVISHTKLMELMDRNPGIISRIVQLKHAMDCTTLDEIQRAYETKEKMTRNPHAKKLINKDQLREEKRKKRQQLIEKSITNPNARRVWARARGMDCVAYNDIFNFLQIEFYELSFSRRSLQINDLRDAFYHFGMTPSQLFPIERFDELYTWFTGLCRLISVLADVWNETQPIKIHGFVSRAECTQKLAQCRRGTFIIRFSVTSVSSIAISYRQPKSASSSSSSLRSHSRNVRIAHIKATLTENDLFRFDLNAGYELAEPLTLDRFIQYYKKIEYLYNEDGPLRKTTITFTADWNIPNLKKADDSSHIYGSSNPVNNGSSNPKMKRDKNRDKSKESRDRNSESHSYSHNSESRNNSYSAHSPPLPITHKKKRKK